ncbi:MAG TPA: hypothetical protein VGD71_19490, partial [Kribbella sp.]
MRDTPVGRVGPQNVVRSADPHVVVGDENLTRRTGPQPQPLPQSRLNTTSRLNEVTDPPLTRDPPLLREEPLPLEPPLPMQGPLVGERTPPQMPPVNQARVQPGLAPAPRGTGFQPEAPHGVPPRQGLAEGEEAHFNPEENPGLGLADRSGPGLEPLEPPAGPPLQRFTTPQPLPETSRTPQPEAPNGGPGAGRQLGATETPATPMRTETGSGPGGHDEQGSHPRPERELDRPLPEDGTPSGPHETVTGPMDMPSLSSGHDDVTPNYVFNTSDHGVVDRLHEGQTEQTRRYAGRLQGEDQKYWQQRAADERFDATVAAHAASSMHGVPADRPVADPAVRVREVGPPDHLIGPVTEAYRTALAEHEEALRRGPRELEGGLVERVLPLSDRLTAKLEEVLPENEYGRSPAELAEVLLRREERFEPEGWARMAGVPDHLVGRVADTYRGARADHIRASREGTDGVPFEERLVDRLEGQLHDLEHDLVLPAVVDRLIREQARLDANQTRPWTQNPKERFDAGWRSAFDEYLRRDLTRQEFEQRFEDLVDELPDALELEAAVRGSRASAEQAFDAIEERAGFSPAEEARLRARFLDLNESEVRAIAERLGMTGEQFDPYLWDGFHAEGQERTSELARGLRVRLELERAAARRFETLTDVAGLDRTSRDAQMLRAQYDAEFTERTRTLPDGRETRTVPYDDWARQAPELGPAVRELDERWTGRLRAKAAENALLSRADEELGRHDISWREMSHRPRAELDGVDHQAVLAEHNADLRAEGARIIGERHPAELTPRDWDDYVEELTGAYERLSDLLPGRFDHQAGLVTMLRRVDEAFEGIGGSPEHVERVRAETREAMTDVYRSVVGRPDDGVWSREELTRREDSFYREHFGPYRASLNDRLLFEAAVERALGEGGRRFHELTGDVNELTGRASRRYALSDETFEALGNDFRTDWAILEHQAYGPPDRDVPRWLGREQAQGDAFGGALRDAWAAFEAEAPRMVQLRETAAAEHAEWRQRLTAVYGDFLRKADALEAFDQGYDAGHPSLASPAARTTYQEGRETLKGRLAADWDSSAGQEAHTALVTEVRDGLAALRDEAVAQDEVYRGWTREPEWTLDFGRLDFTRTSLGEYERRAGLDTTPERDTTATPKPETETAAPAPAPENRQPYVEDAPEETVETTTPEPAPPNQSMALSAAEGRAAEALAGLRATVERRDQAYLEFERRLADYPDKSLRIAAREQLVSEREWFADRWTAEPEEGRSGLGEELGLRLDQARRVVAAKAVFERDVLSTVRDEHSFQSDPRVAALREEFVEAMTGPAATPEARAQLVEDFRGQYDRAREQWRQQLEAQRAFEAALTFEDPVGRIDLRQGGHGWDDTARAWYSEALTRLGTSYANERAARPDLTSQDAARLADGVRNEALRLSAEATAVAELKNRFEQVSARHEPSPEWDPQVQSWYRGEQATLLERMDGMLRGRQPGADLRARLESDYSRQLDALHEVARTRDLEHQEEARTRDLALQQFDRFLAGQEAGQAIVRSRDTVKWAGRQIDELREAYVRDYVADVTASGAKDREGSFIPEPSYAERGGWRSTAWQTTKVRVDGTYEGLYAEHAAEVAGRPSAADRQAFDEVFESWMRQRAGNVPADHLDAVRDQAREAYERQNFADDQDRAEILDGLRDQLDLQAARQIALQRGRDAYERAFQSWHHPLAERETTPEDLPFAVSDTVANTVREQVRAGFEQEWNTAVQDIFGSVSDIRADLPQNMREAAGRLKTLTDGLLDAFDRRGRYESELDRFTELFSARADSFRDRLTESERSLLTGFDAQDTGLSEHGRNDVVLGGLRELDTAYTELFADTTQVTPETLKWWGERFDRVVDSIPARLAAQTAREAALTRMQGDVGTAIESWHTGSPEINEAFKNRFGVEPGQTSEALQQSLKRALGRSVNDRFGEIFGSTGVPEGELTGRLEEWNTWYGEATGEERLHTWLAVETARHAVVAESGRIFGERSAEWQQTRPEHPLSQDDLDRARDGLDERMLDTYNEVFGIAVNKPEDLTGRIWVWDERVADLSRELPTHLGFEAEVPAMLNGAGRSHHALSKRYDELNDVEWENRTREAYREDMFDEYRVLFAPPDLSLGWQDREAATTNAFETGRAEAIAETLSETQTALSETSPPAEVVEVPARVTEPDEPLVSREPDPLIGRRDDDPLLVESDDSGLYPVVGRRDDSPLHSGALAPRSRDYVGDWSRLSSVTGVPRSRDLHAIDHAVDRLPRDPSRRDLRRVLEAIEAWKSDRSSRNPRWDAVTGLERAVRGMRDADTSYTATENPVAGPSYGSYVQPSSYAVTESPVAGPSYGSYDQPSSYAVTESPVAEPLYGSYGQPSSSAGPVSSMYPLSSSADPLSSMYPLSSTYPLTTSYQPVSSVSAPVFGPDPAALQGVGQGSGVVTVEGDGPAEGFEAELHGYGVRLPSGVSHEEYDVIVSRRGLLTIVLDRSGGQPVLEVVSEKARVLVGARNDGRAERAQVVAAFLDVLQRLAGAQAGTRLSRVFPEEAGYYVDPLAVDLPLRKYDSSTILVHHTTTSPLSGLVRLMEHVAPRMRQESPPLQIAYQDLQTGLRFGARGLARYDEWLKSYPEWAPWSSQVDRAELEGALAFGSTQVAATTHGRRPLPKDYSAGASRDSLAAIRSGLGEAPRAFLESVQDRLRADFEEMFGAGPSLLSRRLPLDWGEPRGTVGQYFDNLLLQTPERVIDQHEALAVRTNWRRLEDNSAGGVPLINPPVVRAELRPYAAYQSDSTTLLNEFGTLSDLSLTLYNEGRELRGLAPVGGPVPAYGMAAPVYGMAAPMAPKAESASAEWLERVVRSGLQSIGASGVTEPHVSGASSDFVSWIAGVGPEPAAGSSMNSWEAILLTAYRAGAVSRKWLEGVHQTATFAADAVLKAADGAGLGKDTAYKLARRDYIEMVQDLSRWERITEYSVNSGSVPVVPAGHWLWISGPGRPGVHHAALVVGTRDAGGRQQVLSHPHSSAADPESYIGRPASGSLRMTTIEELLEEFGEYSSVISMTPAWADPKALSQEVPEPGTRVTNPAPFAIWQNQRFHVRTATVNTERAFDAGPKFPLKGRLPDTPDDEIGRLVLVREHVQLIQAPNDQWVRNQVTSLPVKPVNGVTSGQVAALERALNRELNAYVNKRYYGVPESGQQVHLRLKLVVDPDHGEAITLGPGVASRLDARNWGLRDNIYRLLHELFHYFGISDQYVDRLSVFRDNKNRPAIRTDGIMSDARFHPSQPMPAHTLTTLEEVVDKTVVLYGHPWNPPASKATEQPESATTEDSPAAYTVIGGPTDRPLHAAPPGSGKEKEYWNLLRNSDPNAQDPAKLHGLPLATGPDGAKLLVETEKLYLGPTDRYFMLQHEAQKAGGTVHEVTMAIPEAIFGVLRDTPGESSYTDPDRAFVTEKQLEAAFNGISGEPGSEPSIPLGQVLPAGWTLTERGEGWLIGPPPVGAPSGSRDHISTGIPPTVGRPISGHILERTWRDQSHGYFTRDHLADARGFANQITARYIAWKFLGYVPKDLRVVDPQWLDLPDRGIQELWTHALMAYVLVAARINGALRKDPSKVNAALLPRHDPDVLLKSLLGPPQEFLKGDKNAFLTIFEKRLRMRIPDIEDRYRERQGKPALMGPLSYPLFKPRYTVRDLLLAFIDTDAPKVTLNDAIGGITVLGKLDAESGVPEIVAEVRSYGKKYVTAQESQQYHRTLTDQVRKWHPYAKRLLNPTAEDIAAIEAARDQLRRLSAPPPENTAYERPVHVRTLSGGGRTRARYLERDDGTTFGIGVFNDADWARLKPLFSNPPKKVLAWFRDSESGLTGKQFAAPLLRRPYIFAGYGDALGDPLAFAADAVPVLAQAKYTDLVIVASVSYSNAGRHRLEELAREYNMRIHTVPMAIAPGANGVSAVFHLPLDERGLPTTWMAYGPGYPALNLLRHLDRQPSEQVQEESYPPPAYLHRGAGTATVGGDQGGILGEGVANPTHEPESYPVVGRSDDVPSHGAASAPHTDAETEPRLLEPVPGSSRALTDEAARLASMSAGERASTLEFMSPEERENLVADPGFLHQMRQLSGPEFAATAAQLMIQVPPAVEQPVMVRHTLHTILTRMLQDPEVAERLLTVGRTRVIVIPRNEKLTSLLPWRHLAGQPVDDSTQWLWDQVRAASTLDGMIAVAEENLLGELSLVAGGGPDGYSVVTREFARQIYRHGLSQDDQDRASSSFDGKELAREAGRQVLWPDGAYENPELPGKINHSAQGVEPYFAHLTNAYLGTNTGVDFFTGLPRNNEIAWFGSHETRLVPLLQRIYGDPSPKGALRANPFEATQAENDLYRGYRELWGAESESVEDGELTAGGGKQDLRPVPGPPMEDVYLNPPAPRDLMNLVTRAGEGTLRFYRWWSGSGPNPADGWRISDEPHPWYPNDFASWIRDEGPAPTSLGRMNCWEALLFTAYWSGAVDKQWLQHIHQEAAEAAVREYDLAVHSSLVAAETREAEAWTKATTAYQSTLSQLMRAGIDAEVTRHEVDPKTERITPDIPSGHLVSLLGPDHKHVVLALGTRDDSGRQEVLSHGGIPSKLGAAGPGFMQKTTVEELLKSFPPDMAIDSVAPAWSEPGTSRVRAGTGGKVVPVVAPGRRVADPASLLSQGWDPRDGSPFRTVATERLDQKIELSGGVPRAVNSQTRIREDVYRIQAENKQWIRSHVVTLPVKLIDVTPDEMAALDEALNGVLDEYVNRRGYELPRSKDQLHVGFKLVHDPENSEAVELRLGRTQDNPDPNLRKPGPGGLDSGHWGLGDPLYDQVRKVLRRAGLPAEFETDGIMAGGAFHPSQEMPARYLQIIEDVVDGTVVSRDHPQPVQGSALDTASGPDTGLEGSLATKAAGRIQVRLLERDDATPYGVGFLNDRDWQRWEPLYRNPPTTVVAWERRESGGLIQKRFQAPLKGRPYYYVGYGDKIVDPLPWATAVVPDLARENYTDLLIVASISYSDAVSSRLSELQREHGVRIHTLPLALAPGEDGESAVFHLPLDEQGRPTSWTVYADGQVLNPADSADDAWENAPMGSYPSPAYVHWPSGVWSPPAELDAGGVEASDRHTDRQVDPLLVDSDDSGLYPVVGGRDDSPLHSGALAHPAGGEPAATTIGRETVLAPDEATIGLPGVSYPGSSLLPEAASSGGDPDVVHRGEFEVETVEGVHYVRVYTAIADPLAITPTPGRPGMGTSDYRDVNENPESGAITIAMGTAKGVEGAVFWAGAGRPQRAVQWLLKYQHNYPTLQPVLRTFLVPLDTYLRLSSTATSEYAARALPSSSINVDFRSDANQFGVRGTHLEELARLAKPGSLVSYMSSASEVKLQELAGEVRSVSELFTRLGIDGFQSDALGKEYDPWFKWAWDEATNRWTAEFWTNGDALHRMARELRQHHVTYQQSLLPAEERTPSALLESDVEGWPGKRPDTNLPTTYAGRRLHLNLFLNKVGPPAESMAFVVDKMVGAADVAAREILDATTDPPPIDTKAVKGLVRKVLRPAVSDLVRGLLWEIRGSYGVVGSAEEFRAVLDGTWTDSGGNGKDFQATVLTPLIEKLAGKVEQDGQLARWLSDQVRRDLADVIRAEGGAAVVRQLTKIAQNPPARWSSSARDGWLGGLAGHAVRPIADDLPVRKALEAAIDGLSGMPVDLALMRESIEHELVPMIRTVSAANFRRRDFVGVTPAAIRAMVTDELLPSMVAAIKDTLSGDDLLKHLPQDFRVDMAERIAAKAGALGAAAVEFLAPTPVTAEQVQTFMEKLPAIATQAEISALIAADYDRLLVDPGLRTVDPVDVAAQPPFPNDFAEWRDTRAEREELQGEVGRRLAGLLASGGSPQQVARGTIEGLIAGLPELAPKFDAITVPTERFTFYDHAQLVLGQFLTLLGREPEYARFVSTDTVAKAILFHDIEKVASKTLFGKEAGGHDREPEHRLAVAM